MKDPTFLQAVFFLVAGAVAGIVSGVVGAWFKAYLDQRVERAKRQASLQLEYLDPFLISAVELRNTLDDVSNELRAERDLPDAALTQFYTLRWWFRHAKDYVIDSCPDWTDEQRLGDFALHSGGAGYRALSTLYITARYLYFATKIRADIPLIAVQNDTGRLLDRIDAVRQQLGLLDFYPITQESTGVVMGAAGAQPRDFRAFGEGLTGSATRGWFLTLTDVYFKLHQRDTTDLLDALDNLVRFLQRER